MNILVVLACMYLAAVLLNVIQIAKTYKAVGGNSMWIGGYFYAFAITFFHPARAIFGTISAIKDWNWLEGKIGKNENGEFIIIKGENKDA